MKDYLKIHTADYKLVTHQTMNEMEKILPSKQFIRVHKSYIIALAHIKSIYGNIIETGNASIPIGINYKERVMQLTGKKLLVTKIHCYLNNYQHIICFIN